MDGKEVNPVYAVTLYVVVILALYTAVWLAVGGIVFWLYSICLVPLGVPVLGFWQLMGIWLLLGIVTKFLFRRKG